MTPDTIRIHRLRAPTRVGVTAAERATAQDVEFCLRLVPRDGFADLGDEIANAVDYHRVSQRVLKTAAAGERNLIETLAGDVAAMLLAEFPLAEVGVEVRKFILPETEFVAVAVTRRA